jgi:hypothetical protein
VDCRRRNDSLRNASMLLVHLWKMFVLQSRGLSSQSVPRPERAKALSCLWMAIHTSKTWSIPKDVDAAYESAEELEKGSRRDEKAKKAKRILRLLEKRKRPR